MYLLKRIESEECICIGEKEGDSGSGPLSGMLCYATLIGRLINGISTGGVFCIDDT